MANSSNEDVYDAVYTTGTPEEALAYESEFFAPIVDAYIEGSYSYEDALAMIEKLLANKSYMNTYGIEPEAEEGVYMCATPYNLIWVARQVNQNINRSLKFALIMEPRLTLMERSTAEAMSSRI